MAIYGKITFFKRNNNEDISNMVFSKNIELISNNKTCVIFDNLIYFPQTEKSRVESHVRKLLDEKTEEYKKLFEDFKEAKIEYGTKRITTDTKISFRNSIRKLFIQTYKENGKNNYTALDNLVSNVKFYNMGGSEKNEFNEMMNLLYYEYKINYEQMNLSYEDFLVGLYLPAYGRSKNITSQFRYSQSIKNWEVSKFVSLLIPDKTWYKSAVLSAEQMIKSKIFSSKKYIFYSEDSSQYKKIFKDLANAISASGIFDDFFGNLNYNKYFISDALAIEVGSSAILTLDKNIKNFIQTPTFMNLKEVFSSMDVFFYDREFIPISFKQVEDYSLDSLPDGIITEKQVKSSLIKVINPPKRNIDVPYKYKNVALDDFDVMLLILINKMKKKSSNFNNEIKKLINVNNNSFKYTDFITSVSYGGNKYLNFQNLYFEFDLNLTKTKKKTYTFELSNSIKIRTKGTASGTGEGGINTYSLNYVMKDIYRSNFNSELSKISENRTKNIINVKDEEYKRILSLKQIITPAIRSDSQMKTLRDILEKEIKKETSTGALNHFLEYAKSLKLNEKKITDSDQITSLFGNICAKELGLMFDKNIEVENDIVKVTISEQEKDKVIGSIWGLLSGRGPIEFNGQTFKNAKDLEDVAKYRIKFPALVKIGI